MAEIPVHKKSSGAWWLWLLLGLLAVALLFWLLSDDDEAEVVATAPVVTAPAVAPGMEPVAGSPASEPAAQPADAGPITSLAAITGSNGLASMVGREVRLENVRVQDVVGDRTFFVGPDANQRAFVVLNEQPTPGTPIEGRYDVETGQTISLNGTVRRVENGMIDGQRIADMPAGTEAFIWAQSLNILSRP